MTAIVITIIVAAVVMYIFKSVGEWVVHNWYYIVGAAILFLIIRGQVEDGWPIFDVCLNFGGSKTSKDPKDDLPSQTAKTSSEDRAISRLIQEDYTLAVKGAKCPNCGASAKHGMTNCEYCGTRLEYKIEFNKEGDGH